MRKVTVHLFLAAVLLGAVISKSHAATDASGNNATVTPLGDTTDTLGPEPGSISGTQTKAADNPTPPIGSTPVTNAESSAAAQTAGKDAAVVKRGAYRGKYFGGKFGIVNSSASGTTSAPSASTIAYGVQGGYLQGGYDWDLHYIVAGVGAYFHWNNYTIHSNDVGYSSRAYGLDVKLGLPVDDWLPYIKWGYGRSMATSNANLSSVAQYGSNVAVGVEYNFAPRWSAIAEYTRTNFSNRDASITINNKIFTFGFNYYFDIPLRVKEVEKVVEPDLPIPPPILQPDAVPVEPPPP